MTRPVMRLVAAISVVWLSLATPTAALAATPTSVTLQTDPSITVGVQPSVTVRLTSGARPIPGATVELHLDGRQTSRVTTDAQGTATAVVARDLDEGDHEVRAVFRGTSALEPSTSPPTAIHVSPATLTVRTVPPVAGVPLLRVDGGTPLVTSKDGTLRIPIPAVRRYELAVTLPPDAIDRRLAFDRWGDGSRERSRTIRLPGKADLEIGLEGSRRVGFSFVDSKGAPVDPARVETVLIANDRGEQMTAVATDRTWLVENRITRLGSELTSVPIEYRIQEVGVGGSNVVDRGRLHFVPDGQIDTWVIPLLLYPLTIFGQDALFGYPLGTSAQLAHPDGTVASIPLDGQATATIEALPRGNYRAAIEHAPGIPVSTPIVLSRDHSARVPVVSYLDAALLLGAGLTAAIALVLVGGRPVGRALRRMLRRTGVTVLTVLLLPITIVRSVLRSAEKWAATIPTRVFGRAEAVATMAPLPRVAQVVTAQAAMALGARPSTDVTAEIGSGRPTGVPPVTSIRQHSYRPCRFCGSPVTSRARLCRACGRRLRKS
jgi:Bacterial Ig-like domain (group 3)